MTSYPPPARGDVWTRVDGERWLWLSRREYVVWPVEDDDEDEDERVMRG